ncbi:MAG TPA: hypothetical protein VMD06_03950 [Steroidobacteraceae bacterium]|nr:hypothetical protein [Steroidobacteraceae bacterium]
MNTAVSQSRTPETAAAFGGAMDAIGGIATAVLAIIALAGWRPELLAGVATIVFGAALLIQGGTLLSEYSQVYTPTGALQAASDAFSGDGLAAMFPVGIAGIVLGILALLGIASYALTAISVIAFGAALMLSAQSVRKLYRLQTEVRRASLSAYTTREYVAGEMAGGTAGIQFLTGLAAVVLGIIAVAAGGDVRSEILTLVALLVVGLTNIISGSALSGLVLSFMRSEPHGSSTLGR